MVAGPAGGNGGRGYLRLASELGQAGRLGNRPEKHRPPRYGYLDRSKH